MDEVCVLRVQLVERVGEEDGQILREQAFWGRSPQDLAMLGAARGWLKGLYKEAEGPALAAGMIGPMKEMYADMNKPHPGLVMAGLLNARPGKPLDARLEEAL